MEGKMATFLSSTSRQIVAIIAKSIKQASPASTSSSVPKCRDSFCITYGPSVREHFFQLRAVLRACLDGAGPADFLGLFHVGAARRGIKADRLDSRLGLPLRLVLVVRLPEVVLSFVGEHLA